MPAHIDLHGDDLDSRAREVLREIIMQHVATGEPISSRSLAMTWLLMLFCVRQKSFGFRLVPAAR